jgi:arsenate reductase
MSLILYHNPRCSSSRAALQLLQGRGLAPKIVLYLETPPTADEIAGLLKKLKIGARDLLRTKEARYAELGLADASLTEAAIIRAMAENPILIERPVLVSGARAIVGRPPERVLELI